MTLEQAVEEVLGEETKVCPFGICDGSGELEEYGDGDNFEWDVISVKSCRCKEE